MTGPSKTPSSILSGATMLLVASMLQALPAVADDGAFTWEEFSYQPYPLARISEDVARYPQAVPQTLKVSQHGEVEHLGMGVFGTHWFVDADGPVWHFVTAGDPSDDVVLMIHGHPDTW